MRARVNLPAWINLRVVFGGLVIGISMLCLAAILLLMTRQDATTVQSTAIIDVIYAAMATPTSASASPQAEMTENPPLPPSPPPGVIAVGAYVQVAGTGGDGLRLRIDPSLDGQILMLGSESEVFRVHDGPRESDDHTWWYLVGPFDSTRYGWAVANFLVVVQGP